MDAHAHLLSLGWAGPGHALDSKPHKGRRGLAYDPVKAPNNGHGLVKPLLISQKKNTFGIGKKAHEPAAGNEWWLKGFETALSNIGKSDSERERTSGTATPESRPSSIGYKGKHEGLYGHFVRGGEMEGTIGAMDIAKKHGKRRRKRKSDALDDESNHSTSEAETHSSIESSTKRRSKMNHGIVEFEQVSQFLEVRDRNKPPRPRQQRVDALQEFAQANAFFEARSAQKKKSSSEAPVTHLRGGNSASRAMPDERISDIWEDVEAKRRRKAERKAERLLETQAGRDPKELDEALSTAVSEAEAKVRRKAGKTASKRLQGHMPDSIENAQSTSVSETEAKVAHKVERRRKKEMAKHD